MTVEIVRKIADQLGFVLLPRRLPEPSQAPASEACRSDRVGGERVVAWINRNRRLATDVEATSASTRAFFYTAAVMRLVHRIERAS